MKQAALVIWSVVFTGLVIASNPTARADECDDVVAALNKRMDQIRATRKQDDSRTAICARLGRISGLTQAIGMVAEHCMEEGGRRDEVMKDAAGSEQAYEVDNVCR
jgi:hypothetical protein